MDARNYVLSLMLYALLGAALVVAVNYIIDPYGITGAPRIEGLNQQKADINDFARQYKKYQPLLVASDTLVLGNSRAEMGIDPAHACFESSGMTAYNLAMPGAGMRMQLNYALNVIYAQPIKRVFLSVDFIDFIDNEPRHIRQLPLLEQIDGELKYLPSGTPNPEYPVRRAKDYARALFSLDVLTSSAKTVLGQGVEAADRTVQGFYPAADIAGIVRVEGARALYDQKMQNLQRKYAKGWYLRDSSGSLHTAFEDLKAFLEITARENIEVVVFTHPFHESYWQLLNAVGLAEDYQQWMQLLRSLIGQPQFAVSGFWDFSDKSPYITEDFGGSEQRNNALQWFWEPAHYRSELGDKMVAQMLGPACKADTGFGRKLL